MPWTHRTPSRLHILTLAVGLAASGRVVALGFLPPATHELSGSDPTTAAVADFNGDAIPDLAVAMSGVAGGDGKISVLFGGADGAMQDHPFPVAFRPWGIAAADLNSDALADLVITDGSENSNRLFVYHAAGDRFVAAAEASSGGNYPIAVAIGDTDEDGRADLVVANAQRPGLSLVPGTADGFGAAVNVDDRWPQGVGLIFADLNGDRHLDIALPDATLIGDGRGNFTHLRGLGGTRGVAVSDFNGDGLTDVAVLTPQAVRVWAGANSDGDYTLAYLHDIALSGNPQAILAEDLDRDGWPELAVTTRAPDQLLLLRGGGDGSFGPPQPTDAIGVEPGPIATADWNGDGYPDLAVAYRNRGDTPTLHLFLQDPSAAAPVPTVPPPTDPEPTVPEPIDPTSRDSTPGGSSPGDGATAQQPSGGGGAFDWLALALALLLRTKRPLG